MVMTKTLQVASFISAYLLPPHATDVLKTMDDCELFLTKFHKTNAESIDDILDFREYKLEISDMTLDTFLKLCYIGEMKEAFERTFIQSFTVEEIQFICSCLLEGKITLPQVYGKFQKNKNKNILSYFMS